MSSLLSLVLGLEVSFHLSSAQPASSVRYNAKTHEPVPSSGCGKQSPFKLGQSSVALGMNDGIKWTYRIYVPNSYSNQAPMPVILQHPGWGVDAKTEEAGAGITAFADSLGFISVTPQGMNDNSHMGGPWYSWNVVGSTLSPGAAGPTCTSAASAPSYCYDSCLPCTESPQCSWTTCDDVVTPSGTGTSDVVGFVPSLFDTLEDKLCIDTTREFAAGESNGGMMTYQLGVDLASRLAAIAPQFGSFHRGFNLAPLVGVPLLDTHGTDDTTVPANVSLSGDGYYYTTTHEIFNGNEYSSGWRVANNCSGGSSHYVTSYDGLKDLWCVLEGNCSGGDVVRCAYTGGHDWFNNGGRANGGLVTEFLLKWTKPSHIGRGYSKGEKLGPGHPLQNVTGLGLSQGGDDSSTAQRIGWPDQVLESASSGHYGDPAKGCLADEVVVPAGTGHVCAPVIGADLSSTPPTPHCRLGGVVPSSNGCPVDANLIDTVSKAWPICLAKGKLTDGYDRGDFACLLVCPCEEGFKGNASASAECGKGANAHCPLGSRCERGERRKRDQGVCTYPIDRAAMAVIV